ncbi:MAG: DUF1285 domain-containing protein [Pseudolabrys sp.]|nr:DUF1285 domain-containing protein [Pseudolabrys sp.]MDP2296056.1 DUF1285 domain-containing protein [Pseudolabrys sp.]
MAKAGQETSKRGLEGIAAMLPKTGSETGSAAGGKGLPPVHLWNPPFCGDIDMRIATDGTWFYQKTPIGRPALVKLFSSVLKREGDKYFLVTPVEKVGIAVDDAPFTAVELAIEPGLGQALDQNAAGRVLRFRTNVEDWVEAGPGHALRFDEDAANGGLKPMLHVRNDLWAKVTRALFYDLVDLGEERDVDGKAMFGVVSAGEFFPMAEASALKDLT